MKILFTGGSSFSGMWFVKELSKNGHEVVAPLLRRKDAYSGVRAARVKILDSHAKIYENCPFGSESFLDLIRSRSDWDILCHHAADVTDYKSPSFDYLRATENNTHNVQKILTVLIQGGCQKVVITGSVFEQREGIGSAPLQAVSPYGLSKGLAADIFSYWCSVYQMKLGKFVIPNPFGPYEEERFTSYLIKTWLSGQKANVSHPEYVRDNIHISLLAKAYTHFVSNLSPEAGFEKINPSQYVSSRGEFANLFSKEMSQRLSCSCELNIMEQIDFSEPLERVNTDKVNAAKLGWSEEEAWDSIAEFYSI